MELAPGHVMTPEEFFAALQVVPGTERVEWGVPKSALGFRGDHYMDRNINVDVPGHADTPMEFELTRNNHMMRSANRPIHRDGVFQ